MSNDGCPLPIDTGDWQRNLGRMEGKIDAIIQRLDNSDNANDDHETRLRSLEKKVWSASAVAAAGAALVTTVFSKLTFIPH